MLEEQTKLLVLKCTVYWFHQQYEFLPPRTHSSLSRTPCQTYKNCHYHNFNNIRIKKMNTILSFASLLCYKKNTWYLYLALKKRKKLVYWHLLKIEANSTQISSSSSSSLLLQGVIVLACSGLKHRDISAFFVLAYYIPSSIYNNICQHSTTHFTSPPPPRAYYTHKYIINSHVLYTRSCNSKPYNKILTSHTLLPGKDGCTIKASRNTSTQLYINTLSMEHIKSPILYFIHFYCNLHVITLRQEFTTSFK
jgi:hypothetical protein